MIRSIRFLLVGLFAVGLLAGGLPLRPCTIIVVGKKATVDGSLINSHTDACDNSRLLVVAAQSFARGTMAPVYYGIQDLKYPLGKFGEVIGHIPQVGKTYAYLHSGYPHINEHQLAIAESTTSQRRELGLERGQGEQIITIEQAMAFALQRCRRAREALQLITELIDRYGFLPSCGPESETLAIADPQEAWILEVFSIGPGWKRESGQPGALWAAQRIPDDQIVIVPNWSIIKQIDLSRPDEFMASKNFQQVAIDHGWFDPASGKPFVWQDIYAPVPREWAISRLWLFYSRFCPSLKAWPDRIQDRPYQGIEPYFQYLESLSYYPFSAKPDKPLSVQDVMKFQRSTFEGTIYDMTNDPNWLVPDNKGNLIKSPLTTPFPTPDMRHLLNLTFHRNVAKGGYGMIAQLRDWLPDPIGGLYWLFVDNQYVGTYAPVYAGVTRIHPAYQIYDPDRYDERSARWAVDFVDNLLYLKFQEAIKDVRAVRNPLEEGFFTERQAVDTKAQELYRRSPAKAREYLTGYTWERMEKILKTYLDLRDRLISKYSNNRVRP